MAGACGPTGQPCALGARVPNYDQYRLMLASKMRPPDSRARDPASGCTVCLAQMRRLHARNLLD